MNEWMFASNECVVWALLIWTKFARAQDVTSKNVEGDPTVKISKR